MISEEELEGEREYWKERDWESRYGMDYFRVFVRNGIEYHYEGFRCLGMYDPKTGRSVDKNHTEPGNI